MPDDGETNYDAAPATVVLGFVASVVCVLSIVVLRADAPHNAGRITAGFGALVLLPLAGVIAWALRSSTRLDADGIVVRGLLRTRRIAWPSVQDIRVELAGSAIRPQLLVAIYEASGLRTVLPHVNERNLARVGAELTVEMQAMTETWIDRRGADWTRVPQIDAVLAARYGYSEPGEVGYIAARLALTAVIVGFCVAFFAGAFDGGASLPVEFLFVLFFGLPVLAFVVGYVVQRVRRR